MNHLYFTIILKTLFLISLVAPSKPLYGQEEIAVSVEKIVTTDKLISGQIGGEYDITIYLKVDEISYDHGRVYFVKGWYYYDQYKQQIPLMGLWDGELTLYAFEEGQEEQLTWEYKDRMFWEHLDSLKNGLDYKEKFSYTAQDKSGYWTNGEKDLELTLSETDFYILTEKEYLKIETAGETEAYYTAFKQLNIYDRDLSVLNYKKIENGLKILLDFHYTTRFYYSGMCGAGSEVGYILLTYDSENCLQAIERVLTESCEQIIESEKLETPFEDRYLYKISKQEEPLGELEVDYVDLKWEWKE